MREIMHLQVGQCGNQIGSKVTNATSLLSVHVRCVAARVVQWAMVGGANMGSVKAPKAVLAGLAAMLLLGMVYMHRFAGMTVMPMSSCMINNPPPTTSQTKLPDSRSLMTSEAMRRHQILLVTYGRSGSSFTSALISAHPDVFYFFEPLGGLGQLYERRQKLTGGKKFHLWGEYSDAFPLLESVLYCDVRNATALNNAQNRNSNDTRDTYQCLQNRNMAWDHVRCYLQMIESCQSKNTTLIKTIRFRLSWTEELLKTFPNLKVLYLLRDPRAVLFSQAKVFKNFNFGKDVPVISITHCKALTEDFASFVRLKNQYPQRLKAIRYEDGAMDPQTYARNIYNFIGLDYTPNIQRLVTELTSKNTGHPDYSIYKADPTLPLRKWRYSAGFNSVRIVDKECQGLYPLVGYRPVKSQRDLESNLTVVLKTDPSSGIF